MKRSTIAMGVLALLTGLLSAMPLSGTAAEKKAAEKKSSEKKVTEKKATERKSAAKKAAKKKTAAKEADAKAFKGRLPAYYSSVVDNKQRQEIYDIQEEYHLKFDQLKKEHLASIKALTADRNEEIDDVLTDEQKEKVDELKAARGKSTKTSSKKTSTKKK